MHSPLHQILSDQIEEDKTIQACRMNGRHEKFIRHFRRKIKKKDKIFTLITIIMIVFTVLLVVLCRLFSFFILYTVGPL
jgi:t-SNARE complex subunit (syntaxin)